jgi:hypothetical protein
MEKYKMRNKKYRISNNTLGAIIALEAIVFGIFVGLKMGFSFVPLSDLTYIATLGGNRHVVGTIAALICIPICVKQTKKGFLAVMTILSVTAILTSISIIDALFLTQGSGAKAPVATVMLFFQILAIVFSYSAMKEIE